MHRQVTTDNGQLPDLGAERVPKCLDGSQCLGAHKGFEFGKGC
jgi:hypothetical protein